MNEKEKYVSPEITVVVYPDDDIITSSNEKGKIEGEVVWPST